MPIQTLFVFDVEDTWYDDDIGEVVPRFFAETLTRRMACTRIFCWWATAGGGFATATRRRC